MKKSIAAIFALTTASAALAQLPPSSEHTGHQSGEEAKADQQQGPSQTSAKSTGDSSIQNSLSGIASSEAAPTEQRPSEQRGIHDNNPGTQPSGDPDYLAIWTGVLGALGGAVVGAWATLHVGRRQARAAEEANAIARAAANADVRWSGLSLVYSSIYDGDNAIRATVRNYGTGVASISLSAYTIKIDGDLVPMLLKSDVSGVLGPGESQIAFLEFSLNDGVGNGVHAGRLPLIVTCGVTFTADGRTLYSESSFLFDRGTYSFRQKAEGT